MLNTMLNTMMDPMTDTVERGSQVLGFLSTRPVARAEMGQTSHVVVHRQNKACVRYFAPRGTAAVRRPLFISMPLINTWTIFDLLPGRSVIEKLVDSGVPVYLLDWGRAGPEDAAVTLGDLTDDLLPRAIRRSARHARGLGTLPADELMDALGYCVGGTFLALSLARNPGLAGRLALLAAPIDFHASERLATWANPDTFPVADLVNGLGNFPASLMKTSFQLLKPSTNIAKWKSLWDHADDPDFRELWAAMERWNGDAVDFPGAAYREYVEQCYFANSPVHGGWVMNGRAVDLGAGTIPAIAFAASTDHICPEAAAFALERVWGGKVETQTVRGGHVGVCLGRSFPKALLAWLDQSARPDQCAPNQ
jgi:polyhydroxyalkanoate synthase subunit PhaC